MEVSKIIYYTREGDKNKTISLKELNLREEYYLEDVFYAVKDSIDEYDLMTRLANILHDGICLDCNTKPDIVYLITDIQGNTNYLKLKMKKENKNDGT